jgi:hypothetical protein
MVSREERGYSHRKKEVNGMVDETKDQNDTPQPRAKGVSHLALLIAFVAGAGAAWIIISYNSGLFGG